MFKNITLSAEESLIEKARRRASEERRSLNDLFREWIARYAGVDKGSERYQRLMKHLAHVRPGRTFSRDEMNER
jgi:hypothetical protein